MWRREVTKPPRGMVHLQNDITRQDSDNGASLQWFRHVKCHDSLSKTILQGTLDGGHGGNAGRTTSKSGHPCPCQNCPQRPSAEKKTGWGSLLNNPLTTQLEVYRHHWNSERDGSVSVFSCWGLSMVIVFMCIKWLQVRFHVVLNMKLTFTWTDTDR